MRVRSAIVDDIRAAFLCGYQRLAWTESKLTCSRESRFAQAVATARPASAYAVPGSPALRVNDWNARRTAGSRRPSSLVRPADPHPRHHHLPPCLTRVLNAGDTGAA